MPAPAYARDMKHTPVVAVLLFDQVNAIDVAGPMEAFSCVTGEDGEAGYSIVTWAVGNAAIRSEAGLRLSADETLPEHPQADILIVPGGKGIRDTGTLATLSGWLRRHAQRFPRVASICTGAYALAEAGLFDGRHVTTHWSFARDLQTRYPAIRVDADALFLRDGKYYSTGGVTAGIDLALELVDADFGARTAMAVARELVVFLRRSGAQAQFSAPLQMQTSAPGRLGDVCKWAAGNLQADLSVEALAARAGLGTRQFSRRFRDTFGSPPATYIKRLRLDAGRTMLGQGVGVAQAAHAAGFGSPDGFRRAFEAQFGVSPGEYRKRFTQERSPQ